MKALVLHAARDLRVEAREAGAPGPGEVAVRVVRGGICGSDLHYYQDGGFGAVRLREPMILGHEVAGHVAALGPGVTGFSVGELVAVSPSRPDWDDDLSREGMPEHSLGMRFYGSAMPMPHVQGAFRELLVAEAGQCVSAEGLSPGEAAMAEPLAVVLHALKRAGDLMGKRVLVTGCGPIGALAVLAARRAGAAEIVVTDIAAAALAHGERCGADRVIDTAEAPEALAGYAAGKGWFHVLLECSGAAPALLSALPTLRPRGVVVQVGLGPDIALPMSFLVAREIELRGTFRFHYEFPVAVEMMRKGLIEVGELISHHYPLAEAVAAFETAGDKGRSMKVQLEFG